MSLVGLLVQVGPLSFCEVMAEFGEMSLYLASDASSLVSGQTSVEDGGFIAKIKQPLLKEDLQRLLF